MAIDINEANLGTDEEVAVTDGMDIADGIDSDEEEEVTITVRMTTANPDRELRRDFLNLPDELAMDGLPVDDSDPELAYRVVSSLDEGNEPDPARPSRCVAIAVAGTGYYPIARVALFRHESEPDVGYVGLFESDGDQRGVDSLFLAIESIARAYGMTRLVGPVDDTIWYRYRFKTEGFDESPYSCEPTNPESYPLLWEANGFLVRDRWYSDIIPPIRAIGPDKMEKRLQRAEELGYEFRNMSFRTFRSDLEMIHRLVSDLYCDFPAYTPMPFDEFYGEMWGMRFVADWRTTLLAYDKDGNEAGFLVAFPDYGSITSRGLIGLAKRILMRIHPSRYVILYMGVARGHEGIGAAMMALLRRQIAVTGASGIAALIHDGKASGAYLRSLESRRAYRYALYEKDISRESDMEDEPDGPDGDDGGEE